jgi:hypothetical protein
LNRIVRRTANGFEYEADPRHAEIALAQMGMEDCKSVSSPGLMDNVNEQKSDQRDPDEELGGKEATKYRAIAARLNYLSQDRPDIQYAAKEISRDMSKPKVGSWGKVKRLCRYLKGKMRYVYEFDWQETSVAHSYSDSDYAGCTTTRKSTSGGVLAIGSHVVKTWSTTQVVIATSSGEAEYYALVKAASIGLGAKSLLKDLGYDLKIIVHTDSSACKGIASRSGLGKMRRIEVQYLWVQDVVKKGRLVVKKIHGLVNPADLLTKYLNGDRITELMGRVGVRAREGRARVAPAMAKEASPATGAWMLTPRAGAYE